MQSFANSNVKKLNSLFIIRKYVPTFPAKCQTVFAGTAREKAVPKTEPIFNGPELPSSFMVLNEFWQAY